MKSFSRCMNLNCLTLNGFQIVSQDVMTAYKEVANNSMKKAATELQNGDDTNEPSKIRVSIDGSWKKRGHMSLNGVVTALTGGKCIDVEVLSKHCKGCEMWEKRKHSPKFDSWKVGHDCSINHHKSSGAMESIGAVNIFKRSIQKNNLIYTEYLGDGDTSSFNDVLSADPYHEFKVIPEKLECVGHVQKRLGTRLHNLVKKYKGTKIPISGKGKLTEKLINSMQNFYGMTIKTTSQKGDLYQMKKAIYAILFHFTNDYRHQFCPRTTTKTWCKYWNSSKKNITSSMSIPPWIKTLILPIIQDLQADELLKKCLHGETQNGNEALNSLIWSRVPKNNFVGKNVLEMGVHSAVIHYNDGANGVLNVLKYYGLIGSVACKKSILANIARVKRMNLKSNNEGKSRRKSLRSNKMVSRDAEQDKKKEFYVAGGF